MPVLCQNEWTYHHAFDVLVGHHSSFLSSTSAIINSEGNSLSRGIKYKGVENMQRFVIYQENGTR